MTLKISEGNSKMGKIASVSLPSVLSCRPGAKCIKNCYARKLENLRPPVRAAYMHNWEVLNNQPEVFWKEINAVLALNRFFRFHVSGDIPNMEYFKNMVQAAINNPECRILCFTKQYEIVNEYIEDETTPEIPENLRVIFSIWIAQEYSNPHNLPEAHVKNKAHHWTHRPDAKPCPGNCTDCALAFANCWSLKNGEQVVFDQH